MSLSIRAARRDDSALVLALMRELADYENLANEVDASEDAISAALFSDAPRLYCDIVEWNGAAAGFAVWFLNFSTGKALTAQLARRSVEQGYARCEWAVLDWNAPPIAFYRSIDAQVLDEWKIFWLSGDALTPFAQSEALS